MFVDEGTQSGSFAELQHEVLYYWEQGVRLTWTAVKKVGFPTEHDAPGLINHAPEYYRLFLRRVIIHYLR
jgi:hypothetical protein